MKRKILSAILALSMLFSLNIQTIKAEETNDVTINSVTEFKTENLIVNGGFENGLDGWITDGTGVFSVVTDTFVGSNNATKTVVNGKKAVQATVTNTTTKGYIYQEVDVTTNTDYVLNLSWFHLSNTKGSVKVYGDSVADENLLANTGNIFGGEVWYSSTAAFNSGEHEKVIIKIDIFNPDPSKYSSLYFCVDNITLKAAGNTQTIDFETGYPEDFNIRSNAFEVTTEKAYTGTHSIKLTSGSGYPIANATFALPKNRHFAVSFYYYVESGSLGAVAKHAHENGWSGYTTNPIRAAQTLSTKGEWKRAILTPADGVTGSGNNNFIEIAFQNMAPNTVVYIDNIKCGYYDESVDSIAITGENKEGGVLNSVVEAYNYGYNFEDPVSYQWQRSADKKNWVDISGAFSEDYTLTTDDSNKYVRLKVNTSNRYSTSISDAYYSKAIKINEFKTIDEIENITTFTSANIMKNGGFEDGLEGWVTDGTGVFNVVTDTFVGANNATKPVVNGKNALQATVTNTTTAGYIYQEVDVAAHTDYVLNLSWFHLANSKGSVKVYGDSVTSENLLANVGNIFGGEVWYSSTATFNSGEHEKVIIKIDIFNPDPSKHSSLYFCVDNITLKAAGNTQTIDFESGYPEDFNIRGKTYAVTTEKAYTGTHSIKLTSGSDYSTANATFALPKNRHYAVSFYYYIESGSLGAVAKHAHENGWSGYTTNPIRAAQTLSTKGEWKRAILTPADGVTGSGNNNFIEIAFQNMAVNSVVYIDNIKCGYFDESVDSITITGKNKAGGALHADVKAYNYGYSFEDPVSYQWQRSADKKNWSDVDGATTADYKLSIDDSQKYLRLKVNTSNRYSASVVDTYYSNAVEVAEITIEDLKAVVLEEIEELVAGFDANDSTKIKALADALELADELGCDITTISNYADLEAIGLDNFEKVSGATATVDGKKVTVELTLTAPIAESYVTKENFKVYADRADVAYEISAVKNENGKVESVKLDFTKASEEKYCQVYADFGYVCNFSDVLDIYEIILDGEIILTNAEGKEINKLTEITDGVVNGSLKLTAGAAQDLFLVQAIYDESGRLYSSDLIKDTLATGESDEYTFELSVPTDGTLNDKFTFKTFLWKDGELKPFMNAKNSDSLGKTYGIDAVNDPTKPLTVAYIGGSQTQGGYYTTPLTAKIREGRTGEVTAINAGVGGSGTDYGAFRVQNDVVSKNPDVVFVEFTLNDKDTDKTLVRKNVEGVIRQLNGSNHVPVVIFIHIPSKNDESLSASTANYNQVLKHYGLTGIDTHSYIKGLVSAGTYTYADMFQADGVHLNATSGNLVADYIYDAITGDNKATFVKNTAKVDSLFENAFKNPKLISPLAACYDDAWQDAEPGDKVMEGYNTPIEQNLFDHYMVTNTEGATMTFSFVGDKLLLEGLRGKDGRKIQYEVTNEDGSVAAIGTAGNYVAGYNWYKGSYMLLQGLGAGKHTLKITVLSNDDCGESFGIGGISVDE